MVYMIRSLLKNEKEVLNSVTSLLFRKTLLDSTRDERTRVSDVCPCPSPCPRFADMPLSEPVSVSEVMTLSESMSESVSEVQKNLVSVSEPTSEIEIFYLSQAVVDGRARVDDPSKSGRSERSFQTGRSFEPKWSVQYDSGWSFQSEGTVMGRSGRSFD